MLQRKAGKWKEVQWGLQSYEWLWKASLKSDWVKTQREGILWLSEEWLPGTGNSKYKGPGGDMPAVFKGQQKGKPVWLEQTLAFILNDMKCLWRCLGGEVIILVFSFPFRIRLWGWIPAWTFLISCFRKLFGSEYLLWKILGWNGKPFHKNSWRTRGYLTLERDSQGRGECGVRAEP